MLLFCSVLKLFCGIVDQAPGGILQMKTGSQKVQDRRLEKSW